MGFRRRRRGRRSWPQRLLILMNSLLVIACLGSAALFGFIRQKASELPTVIIDDVARQQQAVDAPRNILLVGTDNCDALPKDDPVCQGRESENLADVVMILRVDPATKAASLLSIPRDTWLPISPNWSKSKINTSYESNDGSKDLIATIKHNFGISIDNFMQVDFAGFRALVEVLGGIPTYNTKPIRDPATGLYLVDTGCIVIDPTQALAYARSRHLEYQDNDVYDTDFRWRADDSNDLGRISRQQDFIRQAAQRAIDEGIRNPTTAAGLINAGIDSVTVDSEFTVKQMLELLSTFRNFSVDSLVSNQLPTVGNTRSSDREASYQLVVWDEAEALLDEFRGIREEGETMPSDVIVGLPESLEVSAALARQLDAIGFDAGTGDSTVEVSSSRSAGEATTIRFGLRGIEAAKLLASHLTGPVEMEYTSVLPGRRLELLPADVTPEVQTEGRPLSEVPEPSIPESEQGLGTTTTERSTTTVADSGDVDSSTVGNEEQGSESGQTTPTLQGDVTTTTAIGVLTLDAEKAVACPS